MSNIYNALVRPLVKMHWHRYYMYLQYNIEYIGNAISHIWIYNLILVYQNQFQLLKSKNNSYKILYILKYFLYSIWLQQIFKSTSSKFSNSIYLQQTYLFCILHHANWSFDYKFQKILIVWWKYCNCFLFYTSRLRYSSISNTNLMLLLKYPPIFKTHLISSRKTKINYIYKAFDVKYMQ